MPRFSVVLKRETSVAHEALHGLQPAACLFDGQGNIEDYAWFLIGMIGTETLLRDAVDRFQAMLQETGWPSLPERGSLALADLATLGQSIQLPDVPQFLNIHLPEDTDLIATPDVPKLIGQIYVLLGSYMGASVLSSILARSSSSAQWPRRATGMRLQGRVWNQFKAKLDNDLDPDTQQQVIASSNLAFARVGQYLRRVEQSWWATTAKHSSKTREPAHLPG